MKNYMVFDVGGSMIKFAVMTENGDFIEKGELPVSETEFTIFQESIVQTVLENKIKYQVAGIAFSCPGGVESETGIIGGSSALPFIHGPNFKEIFGTATNLPVELENDANCAALGEVWKGAAKTNENVLFTIIGTGIGGAVIKDRRIHKGANLHGGEIGYMVMQVVEEDGKPAFQTWSQLAATGALVKKVAKRKGIDPKELNGKKIFQAAEEGDTICLEEIDAFYLRLAQGIYNIQYVYDPEKIIIGGAISNREDLIEQIYKKLDILLESVMAAKVRPVIEQCQYKNDANLIGALYHYLQCQKAESVEA